MTTAAVSRRTRTTCPYCGVGCGVLVETTPSGSVHVSGDAEHPANFGRLCSKGAALGATLGPSGRLLAPQLRAAREDDFVAAEWDHALDFVAQRLRALIAAHGPDSVALYVSGQLLTEDYYVANKWVKGWLGTANIDTNSRLCMASAVAGHKRAFGEDIVPCSYQDLEAADLLVLVGSNTAWCHPVLYQRMQAARARRADMRLVVIDPRRTPTCDGADLHLPLLPGSDGWLFQGLFNYLDARGHGNTCAHAGLAATRAAAAAAGDLASIARRCGVDIEAITEFYRLFEATPRVVTLFSQGINQSSSGTDKVNAIINCHLLTGRIGAPGQGPFSITGQPNAMGGREVGGLANTLAAHLELDQPHHRALVQTFWSSPRIAQQAGPKAVDLFEAIGDGRIKAVWILGTNPAVSMPLADNVRLALSRCELVVVSDCVASTDTAALAHVLLPAATWGEKDGTVTNSERTISRQRAFLPRPHGAREDWWMLCQVARRVGASHGFDFTSPDQIFREHAALSAYCNEGESARYFDLGGLAELSADAYHSLAPLRWPVRADGTTAPFAFARATLIPITPRPPRYRPSAEFPLTLLTGRIRDQWHTMTRTARAPQLNTHRAEPFVEMHAQDALLAGVADGQLVRVRSPFGAMVVRLRVTEDQRRGSVFAPMHWSDAYASDARVGALIGPAVDPISGEPEFKAMPCRVESFAIDWSGFALTREEADTDALTYWARSHGNGFERLEFAGRGRTPNARALALSLLPAEGDWLEFADEDAGDYRAARIACGHLQGCMYLTRDGRLPAREWLGAQFGATLMTPRERLAVLAGRAPPGTDAGPTVCACLGVGRSALDRAIAAGANQLERLSQLTRAGTNCGSCLPELRRLLAESAQQARA